MFRIALALLAVVVSGCATVARVPTDYEGADAGRVVIGIGATNGTSYSSYSFLFRRRMALGVDERPARGRFTYFQENYLYKQAPDYVAHDEAGVVLIHSLPPGDYEIYNFNVFFNGTVQRNFGSKTDFSIPFSIRPGQSTYLGNYQANYRLGSNFVGMTLPAGAVFVVTDRLDAEWVIAEKKTKAPLGTAVNAAPDPRRLGNPFFLPPQPSVKLW